MSFLEWLVAQWPLVVGGAVAAMAIAGWVERLKRVQELELKIKQLERTEEEHSNRVIVPTSEEVERYGRRRRSFSQLAKRPDLFLELIGILGPLIAGLYHMHRISKTEQRLDAEIAHVQSQIDTTDRQVTAATIELQNATDAALKELSGTGGTRQLGMGPAYRALVVRRDQITESLRALQHQKAQLVRRRSAIELERRETRPIVLLPEAER
jgi:hypothetical protein